MKALLIVDLQNDFCPGGTLAVKGGDAIVPVVNDLMGKFPVVAASQDLHPKLTIHYTKWPVHCLAGTRGADFHPDLKREGIHQVFQKGTKNKDDGYSAFEATNLDLERWLREKGADELYVCGLATDYCVKASALDSVKKGFKTYVVTDAVAAVDVKEGDGDKALDQMRQAGAVLIRSSEL